MNIFYYYNFVYLYNIVLNTVIFDHIQSDIQNVKLLILSIIGFVLTLGISFLYQSIFDQKYYLIISMNTILAMLQLILCVIIRKDVTPVSKRTIYIINSFIVGFSIILLGLVNINYNPPPKNLPIKRIGFHQHYDV
jgi:hypothetical protein